MRKDEITTYSADGSTHSIIYHLNNIWTDLPRAHALGARLFYRNLTALYRQSFLGFGWILLPPLANASLWILLQGTNVISVNDTNIPYPIFVLTGTFLWQQFSEAISAPLNQVIENKAMLSKINIPREGLLLSGGYQLIFNTVLKLFLLGGLFVFFHQMFSLSGLIFALFGIFVISLAGFSIGLALTPIGLLYQDINKGLAVLLPFFMYLTPVVYPIPPNNTIIGFIMKWNPLATLITQTRNWLTSQPVYDIQYFGIFTFAFALLFLISLIVYRLSMPIIIERIGT